MGKLAPMSAALGMHRAGRPAEHLADGSYAKLDDIAALADAGVTACVKAPTPRDKAHEATAECASAQARNRRLRQFVERGLDKVRSIALWHALTQNYMVCGWRLAAV
jgi:hypothetical protein